MLMAVTVFPSFGWELVMRIVRGGLSGWENSKAVQMV